MKTARHSVLAHAHLPRRRPGRPAFDTTHTREALLNSAEELFARFGVEAVSIRSINAAAGFSPATVHSHFRSKDRLLEAVLLRRGSPATVRHCELLDALAAAETTPTALDLVKAWAIPYGELIRQDAVGGFRWLQLLARLVLAQDPRVVKVADRLGLVRSTARVTRLAFPDVPEQLRQQNVLIAFGTLVQMMANKEIWIAYGTTRHGNGAEHAEVEMPARFVAAGLAEMMAAGRAATPQRPRHSLPVRA